MYIYYLKVNTNRSNFHAFLLVMPIPAGNVGKRREGKTTLSIWNPIYVNCNHITLQYDHEIIQMTNSKPFGEAMQECCENE